MEVQRTIPISIPDDPDVSDTVAAFQMVTQSVSRRAFEHMERATDEATRAGAPAGTRVAPPSAITLHHACYGDVRGLVSAQMTATAIRLVAGAYRSAWRKGHAPRRRFGFDRPLALWLIGDRGRDASLPAAGALSLWTRAGRRRLPYRVAPCFQERLDGAVRVNSLTVTADPADVHMGRLQWEEDEGQGGGTAADRHGGGAAEGHDGGDGFTRTGRLRAWLTVTVEVPDPAGHSPVGIDRGAVNALVAVDADDRVLFLSGREHSARNERTRQVQERVRVKKAARQAQGRDTRSVRRLLERLGRKQHNRNRDFARQAAGVLCRWAPPDPVFVLEDLRLPAGQPVRRGQTQGRLPGWPHGRLRECLETADVRIPLYHSGFGGRNKSSVWSRS